MNFHFRNFIVLSCLIIGLNSFGQTVEAGFNLGYNFSRLGLTENSLNSITYVREGAASKGGSFGVQILISPPEKQSSPGFKIAPSFLFEASLCRCGGNIELSKKDTVSGFSSFSPLNYLFYKGDYSAKFVAGIKKAQFLIGPTISNLFYSGVKNTDGPFGYASASDQLKIITFGYEIGAALKLNTFQLSLRYHKTVGGIGRKTENIPTEYKYYQLRVMVHYYFLKKSSGLNWGSIYWK